MRAITAIAVLAGIGSFPFLVNGAQGHRTAATRKPARVLCETALLHDWADGRIDRNYAIPCYGAALKSLPVDLLIYSSAHDDITQARSQRVVQSASGRPGPGRQSGSDIG